MNLSYIGIELHEFLFIENNLLTLIITLFAFEWHTQLVIDRSV